MNTELKESLGLISIMAAFFLLAYFADVRQKESARREREVTQYTITADNFIFSDEFKIEDGKIYAREFMIGPKLLIRNDTVWARNFILTNGKNFELNRTNFLINQY